MQTHHTLHTLIIIVIIVRMRCTINCNNKERKIAFTVPTSLRRSMRKKSTKEIGCRGKTALSKWKCERRTNIQGTRCHAMKSTGVCTLHCQHNFEFNNASRRCRRRRRQSPHQRISYIILSGLVRRTVRWYARSPGHSQWTMSLRRLHITDFPQAILCESSCTRKHRRKYHQSLVPLVMYIVRGSGTNEVYAEGETLDRETIKETTTSNTL